MSAVKRKAQSLLAPAVAMIEWAAPLMAAENWIPELVTLGGGCAAFGRDGVHATSLRQAEMQEADPDFIIVAPCGLIFTVRSGRCVLQPPCAPDYAASIGEETASQRLKKAENLLPNDVRAASFAA